ncbi:NACHT, LRR and PYD domains-containing protein 3-like isoform X2 [Osmerus eperlanus]
MATSNAEHLLRTLDQLGENNLKRFQWYLQNEVDGFNPIPKSKLEKADRPDTVDKMVESYGLERALKITVKILGKIPQNDLAESLMKNCSMDVSGAEEAGENTSTSCLPQVVQGSSNPTETGDHELPSGNPLEYDEYAEKIKYNKRKHQLQLKSKYEETVDRMKQHGKKVLLDSIFTELYITEAGGGEVNHQHEVRQIEAEYRKIRGSEKTITFNNIFKCPRERNKLIRTVLTKGIAGIGKTFSSLKFTLDWANGNENQDIDFIFPLPFRQLNLFKQEKHNLIDVIHKCFKEMEKELLAAIFTETQENKKNLKVLFILDGLDEFQINLNYEKYESCDVVTEPKSIDVLLTNLIMKDLLPSALLWITSRPVTANQIPSECVDLVTEVRGFNEKQREEYFKKRCSDEKAKAIISHIKQPSSKSLYIMCHIPVIAFIIATVLETHGEKELPKTLTQVYILFLVDQVRKMNVKYNRKAESDAPWDKKDIKIIRSLGKLAFKQLEKGNLIFHEADLRKCDIDVQRAANCSGVCTEIFSEDKWGGEEKVYCFIHLTIQELFAALHVFLSFRNDNVNLMSKHFYNRLTFLQSPVRFYKSAVNRTLESENGQLDLFLRFLLGLSMESNQELLTGLLIRRRSSAQSLEKTVKYINKKIREDPSPERCMNLFHCLNELNDRSLVQKIQYYLSSGSFSSEKLSSTQWSALVFVLLTLEEKLDVFDLKIYSRSEEGLLRLLPVVKASKTALLTDCNLSERCCEALASVLPSSDLRELNLSNNDLGDSGMKLLSDGLGNPGCKLETLRLSDCLVTEEGCASLASALRSNPFHLRELDLSYNHPGEKGLKLLSAGLEDPLCKLEKLNVDYGGECRIKPIPRRYVCELTLDPNTAHGNLSLSEENRKVTWMRDEQLYPDHPERFDYWPQVLCREGLSGRCYWEAEWSGGGVYIAVTYKGISRRGRGSDCRLGFNNKSWRLYCGNHSYFVWHNKKRTDIPVPPSGSHRVGVYLDWPAGTLSFYTVSSDTLTHLHTFHTTFSEPLYPGFMLYDYDSSVPVSGRIANVNTC